MNSNGQKTQKRILHYLQSNRIHPALLLTGSDPQTQLTVAKTIAKFHLCQNRGPNGPCDQCSSCRRVEKDLHPDVIPLKDEAEEVIKIDSVREVCHQMAIAPIEGRAKICLVEQCHRLNQAASNAFLKSLEEPGANRYFILMTSQPGALLPTLLSRCLEFSFKPIEEVSLPEQTTRYTPLLKALLLSHDITSVLSEIKEKEECLEFLKFLQHQFRDAMVNPPSAPEWKGVPPYGLLRGFEGALELEGKLRSNANHGLLLESFLKQTFLPETP